MSSVFEKMCSEEYKTAFAGKLENQLNLPDKTRVKILQYIHSDTFDQDMERLKERDWFLEPPVQRMVRKRGSNRRRIVYVFQERGNFLLKYMTFVLQDLDGIYADSLCSFRAENRTKLFFQNVRRRDPQRELYIAKADFHDYGASIDQDLLLEILRPFFEDDPDFYEFVRWLMTRNEFYRDGKLMRERVSIVEGLPIGSFFANIYLRDMDLELEPEGVLYMRYTDDIAFLTDSPEKASWAMERIRWYAGQRRLTVNEEKTELFAPGQEAELLGIQVFPGGFDIGEYALEKLMSKLKRYTDRQVRRTTYGKCSREQAMHSVVRFYDRTFFGKKFNDHELNWVIHAFPIITRTDGICRLDACAQNCIRIAGSGKKTNAKYRIRYKDMVNAGYRSLVHAYYHGWEADGGEEGQKKGE